MVCTRVCVQLKPKYQTVAARLAGEANLIVAQMDRTRNDFPFLLNFERYPTVFLFKAGAFILLQLFCSFRVRNRR